MRADTSLGEHTSAHMSFGAHASAHTGLRAQSSPCMDTCCPKILYEIVSGCPMILVTFWDFLFQTMSFVLLCNLQTLTRCFKVVNILTKPAHKAGQADFYVYINLFKKRENKIDKNI